MAVDPVQPPQPRVGRPADPAAHDAAAPPPRVAQAQPRPPVLYADAPAAPALLAACSTPQELQRDHAARRMRPWAHSTLPPARLYTAAPTVTHPGDPAYGTLTTVRIQHLRPENDAAAMVAGLVSELAALGYLEANGPKHVFAEGVFDEPPRDRERIRAQVEELFGAWQPGDAPNERQLSALRQLGAARLYALRHRDVMLHPVATRAQSEADDAYFNHCRATGLFPSIAVVFDRREERIIKRLQAFYAMNPGESAVVVFGAHHDFGRHVSPAFNPRVVEVQLTP